MKKATSLIELVLALVIVGVGVAALPVLSVTSNKSNAQTILSEVITSSRTYISDVFLEPWNSRLSQGFIGQNGTVMYTGILNTNVANDRRFNESATQYFNRTKAIDKNGNSVQIVNNATTGCDNGVGGINCTQRGVTINGGAGTKNAFSFYIEPSAAQALYTTETFTNENGRRILTSDFNTGWVTGNGRVFDVVATGINGAPLVDDDINQTKLRGFAFNIGSEPK